MNTVISKDGTPIAYDRTGQGPALIIVTGAIAKRSDAASVAAALSPHFNVFAYDRRGRGDSGDTGPYAVQREIEDIAAVIHAAGGSAYLFGHSSGAVLALDAAAQLPGSVKKLAVYEPVILVDDSRPPFPEDYLSHLSDLIASGHRSQAVIYYFSKGLLVPEEELAKMQKAPIWPAYEAVAPTLLYDSTIVADTMSGKPLSKYRWASVAIPTLVMDGDRGFPFLHSGAEALAYTLPNAQRRRFPGQDHHLADELLVPALVEFFKG